MDVRLPDGSVIRGVPDGTSKADLVAKLQRNGYDTSWYQPDEKSYASRVLDELPGAFEGSARMLAGAPGYIAGGVAGAATAPFAGIEAARAVQEGVSERLSPDTYLPPDGRTDAFNEILGALNEKAGEIGMAGGEAIGGDVGGLVGQIGAQVGLQLLPVPGARAIGKRLPGSPERKAAALQAEAQKALEAQKLVDAAKQKEFAEKATQRDWITEQAGVDMGPPRPSLEMPPIEQRAFWERPTPPDTGLEGPARREGGEIPYEKTSPLDIEAKGKEPAPMLRDDGVPYIPATDGISRILEQKKAAEVERAFEKRDAETRSGLPREAEVEQAYAERTPEQPGPTFLEKLESDLTSPKGPKRISSATPMGRQRGAINPEVFKEGFERVKNLSDKGIKLIARFRESGFDGNPVLVIEAYRKDRSNTARDLPIGNVEFETTSGKISKNSDLFAVEARVNPHLRRQGIATEMYRFARELGNDIRWANSQTDAGFNMWEGWRKRGEVTPDLRLPAIKSPLGGPGKKQGGAFTPFAKREPSFNDFLKELEHAKLGSIPFEVKQRMWENRHGKPVTEPVANPLQPTEKVVKATGRLSEEVKELYYDQRDAKALGEDLKRLHEEGLSDTRGGSRLVPNAYRAAKHTMTRWVNSHINEAKDGWAKWAEELQIGKMYKGAKRVVDPNSPRGLWNALDNQSKIAVNKLGNYLTDKDIPLTPENVREAIGRELLPAEERALTALSNIPKQVLDRVINPARKAHGLAPIPARNFYWSPATWAGDYIYFIKNAAGEVIDVIPVTVRPDSYMGRVFNRRLRKALQEQGLTFDPANFKRKTTAREFSLAGMETLFERRGSASDKQVRFARDTAEAIMADFNMRRARSAERKGRPGYRGSEEGLRGVKEFERVMDEYVTQAANNGSNLAIGRLLRDFTEEPATSLFPKARDAALAHFERSMGGQAKAMKALDQAIANSLDQLGLPPSWWDRGVNRINGVATRMLIGFGLPLQLAIQVFQPAFALPKMIQLYGRSLGVPPALGQFAAPLMVLKPIARTVRDILTRDQSYMKPLAEEGALSPSMKHEYTGFGDAVLGERGIQKTKKFIIGDMFQQFAERNVVRAPAARLIHNTLKDLGVEGTALTRITKGLTEDYMVAWEAHKKAGWIGAGGSIGRLLGALQSFSTTYLGQFLEYGRNAVTRGEVMPLAAFLGVAYALGGLLGTIGVKEADVVINGINKAFDTTYKTATEFILEYAKPDEVRYGFLSAMTESNVSATFGAPSATYIGAPGVQLMGNLVKAIGVLWKHAFGDVTEKPTREETRDAIKGVVPRVLHGNIENRFDYPTGTTDATGKLIIKRNEFDKAMRHLGTYSLREAEAKRMKYMNQLNEQRIREKRTKFLERMSQHIMQDGRIPKEFLAKAPELGYRDASGIRRGLMEHLKNKYLDPQQRAVGRGTTEQQYRAYQLYMRLQSEEERARANNSR